MDEDVEKFIKFCSSDFGKRVLEREAEYIRRELIGYQKILDVGCGIGQFEQKLQNLNITGLDNSEEMLIEARKRSDKKFILGNAEKLRFKDSSFDAVFYVTTLEFIDDYKKSIDEAVRVLEPEGKLVVMLLNPESEYFKAHMQKEDSYFRKIKHTNLMEIKSYISKFYQISKEEYFLGIRGQQVFDSSDKRFTSLYVVIGEKL